MQNVLSTKESGLAPRDVTLEAVDRFLDEGCEEAFQALFRLLSPQLIGFFRRRGCEESTAEDLAQEVMLAAYTKAGQLRERALFRSWLFRIAHHALCRHHGQRARQIRTTAIDEVPETTLCDRSHNSYAATMDVMHWLKILTPVEQEIMVLRFIEAWEYHEIATAHSLPIGTVQWRVFNSKKKLMAQVARTA